MIAASAWLLVRHTLLWFEILGIGIAIDALAVLGSHFYDKRQQRKAEQPAELPEARWLN
jgi:hypothetical protein